MQYQLLGKSGVRVSEICLGTMTFGKEWGWGADEKDSREVFDAYLESGGNFIDTANRYTEGTSEQFLGKLINGSGKRDDLVIATKFSLVTRSGDGINRSGNHRKNIVQSVEGSLKRLGLDYIDLYYLHAWDYTTRIEEVLRALDDLVRQGKILYTGISDTPAWIVSRGDAIAQLQGWTPFSALQVEYSMLQRSTERELIPMAAALDMAVLAWAPIAGGALTGKYLENNSAREGDDGNRRLKENSSRLNERARTIAAELVAVAGETKYLPHQIAIAWVKKQGEHIIPLVGARTAAQLRENLAAADVMLSDEQWSRLDAVSRIDPGFPHEFLQTDGVKQILYGNAADKLTTHRKGF
ncbi:MAG TPA: aldo/keto reductase [Chitinophagales bacterium]|nr:aldo/keto reductase [Chitinophagales bacterium]